MPLMWLKRAGITSFQSRKRRPTLPAKYSQSASRMSGLACVWCGIRRKYRQINYPSGDFDAGCPNGSCCAAERVWCSPLSAPKLRTVAQRNLLRLRNQRPSLHFANAQITH